VTPGGARRITGDWSQLRRGFISRGKPVPAAAYSGPDPARTEPDARFLPLRSKKMLMHIE